MRGAIGNLDVAQIVLYAFWLFFFGLLFYLRREDRREGYPLESEAEPGLRLATSSGFRRRRPSGAPTAVRFRFPISEPTRARSTRRRRNRGRALRSQPNGDPMLAGVGPGSYAERADETVQDRRRP